MGDRTYEQIKERGTKWKYFLNWSQMIDIDCHFQDVEF